MEEPVLAVLAHLAPRQAGCLTTQQLLAAGLTTRGIESVGNRHGLASAVHRVYVHGADHLSDAALLRAAVLRGGPQARLAERTALAVYGLVSPEPGHVVVWKPRRSTTTATTVRVRTRLPTMATGKPATIELRARRRPGAIELVGDLPVSHPIDALVGFAAHGHTRELSKAWREADFRSLLSIAEVEARLGRGVEGSTVIRGLMERHPIVGEDTTLLSRAEQRLLVGLTRRKVTGFGVNRVIRFGYHELRPDFFFIDEQLAVEVLGSGHDSPARQEEDVERIRILRGHGVEVLEIGDTEVWRDLDGVLDLIEARRAARQSNR